MNSGSLSGAILTVLSSENTAFMERHKPKEELKRAAKGQLVLIRDTQVSAPRELFLRHAEVLGKPSYGIRCLPNQKSAQDHMEPEDYRETQS